MDESLVFHVISRGNNRARIFHDEDDLRIYRAIVKKCREEHDFHIFHYSFMPNHVHLMLEVRSKDHLAKLMKSLNQTYSWTYKARHGFVGHVWQNRFRRYPINNDGYLSTCGIYIELNAVRAGMVVRPKDHNWSSYRAYAYGEYDDLITIDPVYLGSGVTPEGRQEQYRKETEGWLSRPVAKKDVKNIFRGWNQKLSDTFWRKTV